MSRLFMIIVLSFLCGSEAVESPQYKVVHSESDFEVRLYRESSWMSAQVREATSSFEKATKDGFHRLYQYIHGDNVNSSQIAMTAPVLRSIIPSQRGQEYYHGDNVNSSQIAMTAPVLTSIVPSQRGQEYYVKFYLPAKYERTAPQPYPELNLQFDNLRSRCIAVRKFSGFAKDGDIGVELGTLTKCLNKHYNGKPGMLKEKSACAIAQYNSSHHVSGRLNDVWLDLSAFGIDC